MNCIQRVTINYGRSFTYIRQRQLYGARFKPTSTTTKVISEPQNKIPRPNVRWFYASDVPISKPEWFNYKQTKQPESFIPFSEYDSINLEKEYQKLNKNHERQPKPIEVNEDKLFEVNVKNYQLSPAYWDGPIYEVRRGIWFDSDGKPLNKDLTNELENGFKNVKPYLFNSSYGDKKSKSNKDKISKFNKYQKQIEEQQEKEENEVDVSGQKDVYKLNNDQLVLYFNENQAVIFPKTLATDFQIDIIRYFGPNPVSLLGVEHIERGYSEKLKQSLFDKLPNNPLPGIADTFQTEFGNILGKENEEKKGENTEEEINEEESTNEIDDKHMQQYLETDYDLETSKTKSNREIDHLILCVHGIGQVLGSKYESVNFTHNINVLRNTMKKVFEENDEYKKLISSNDKKVDQLNNKIQVLPISWRHKVDFSPQMTKNENKDSRLPTLSQINVDGIRSLRNVVGDVILDVLLFYQPKYLNQIFEAVISEMNKVYKLYKQKNPNFNGKIHLLGHSLGSAIIFDILSGKSSTINGKKDIPKDLEFNVENLFLVGSPVGLFKLLEGKNIEARSEVNSKESEIIVSPNCKNLYNLFHPCDPIAYRLEPLVTPKFGDFKAVPIEFAVKGINSQIKDLANFGDEISEKISSAVKWLSLTQKSKNIKDPKTIEEEASNENALGDLISSIALSDNTTENESKKNSKSESTKRKLTSNELIKLTSLNETGRIDYSLPMGVLDLSLVSAVSAHISYFEDENTAGFLMKEILSKKEEPVDKSVTLY
ncbi:uncharacterized protein KGF55_001982 [Candida pseudojiufengensis]|uniref:uncharacterized protein n=1 Tax=Candida pseudojiufengensis TaxID=497109 RepID=UPI002224873C|nr:uncharacterized protein KGF55_001982 [Candida pseudojiufengensis]KAI5964911.1 hypothetical protein KGF55_001982 [Candida pseudojiufengensis]